MRFGVSRPTVRSAIKTLAAMGIVQARQGAGTFITAGPPTLDSGPLSYLAALHGFTRSQMFEARIALEVVVAGFAAERATPTTLITVSDETTAMFASLDDPPAFLVHDIQFHKAVASAAGNPVLAAMVDMVSDIFLQVRRDRIQFAKDLKPAADEHRAIYLARARRRPRAGAAGHARSPASRRSDADRRRRDGRCRTRGGRRCLEAGAVTHDPTRMASMKTAPLLALIRELK